MTPLSPLGAFAARMQGLRPPFSRAIALAGLLLAELIAFGVAFDLGAMPADSSFWSRAFVRTPRAIAMLIAAAMVVGLIGGKSLCKDAADSYAPIRGRHRWRLWLVSHLVLLGLFYWTTARIFSLAEDGIAPGREATLASFGLACSALACAALALLPASLWPRLAWRGRWALLSGLPLGAIAWLAAWVSGRVGWKLLGNATIVLVDGILGLAYPETVLDLGTMTVGTPDFAVDVVATCSGYQGIGLICVFLSVYLWLFRGRLRFPRALLLLPLGVCAIWLANVLRIVLLIVVGASGWPEIAHGGFHSQAGWLAFNAVALGFAAFAGTSRYLNREASLTCAVPRANSITAYLAPFLGVVLTAMVSAVLVRNFDWYYPVRVIVAFSLLAFFRGSYRELTWDFAWRPILLGTATFFAWVWLVPDAGRDHPLPSPGDAPAWVIAAWLIAKTVGYVLVTPLIEELAFRGYLMRRLISADFQAVDPSQFTWRALAVSSLAFGALHGQHWIPATLAGLAFGIALSRRAKLADAVMAHIVVNGLIAACVFATGRWYLWG
jgi:exosortase E/protease (VPEID-CTERM system)